MNSRKLLSTGRWLALALVLRAGDALAADGCVKIANTYYQIGQTAEIEVTNDMVPGTVVREGDARGDGHIVARCVGNVSLYGAYVVEHTNGLLPLIVDSEPSGFGIEIYVHEDAGTGIRHEFPHHYQRDFGKGGVIRSNDVNVGYRVKRIEGPIRYGQVEQLTLVDQRASTASGGWTAPFRHMYIYEMSFKRPSCSITAESINQTVSMGSYSLADFRNADRATAWVNFKLRVEECKEPVGQIARFTFGNVSDADPDVSALFRMLGNSPSHVGLEIANEKRRTIEPGKPYEANALATGDDFNFYVRLRETLYSVGGGAFTRPVTVRVDFR